MPTILTEVRAVYLGPDNEHCIASGHVYHLSVIFIRELRTVIVYNKDMEHRPDNFYSYCSWQGFTENWDIVDVLL